jgi:hypothetical protein
VVRFKDPALAELARNNTEWLNELGNNTKLVMPRFKDWVGTLVQLD